MPEIVCTKREAVGSCQRARDRRSDKERPEGTLDCGALFARCSVLTFSARALRPSRRRTPLLWRQPPRHRDAICACAERGLDAHG